MQLSASKVIAILCITATISCASQVLTEVQQQNFNNNNYYNNKNSSYELNILNKFLDYNHLHRAIIIYTAFTLCLNTTTESCQVTAVKDKFVQPHLMRNLTENYHIQFVNTLSPNSIEILFQALMRRVVVFMRYNADDKEKQMILKLVSMREMFKKSLKWLLLMEGIKDPLMDIQHELGHLNILLDADLTVAVYREDSVFDLYDIYKICHKCGSPLEIVYKGNWTTREGFTILNKFHYGIAIRRNNLKMSPVEATTVILDNSPTLNMSDLEYLNNDRDFLSKDAMQRKTYQLLKSMEALYNFTFNIHFTKDWGKLENGSWTGGFGLLYNHQAEMGLCPVRYLLQRITVFDYSRNIHTENIRNIFLEPLADTVWWCVLALIVVTVLLLAIHIQAEYKIFQIRQSQQHLDGSKTIQLPVESHLDFIVFYIMEAILMQGPALEVFRSNSTRLLIVSVSIFSILLMQFYGAFIVSSLLSEVPRTITNLQALYNSSLELGIEDVAYNYDVLMNNKDPMVRNLYKYGICDKHTNRPNAMTLEEGAKKIAKGNFGFHVSIDRAYRYLKTFLTDTEICDLQEIRFHPFITFTCGVLLRKSTPLYEFITLATAMFQEAALMPYNNKKWEVHEIDCKSIQSEVVEIDLEHFAPALVFLFVSMLMSVLALIIEIIYKKFALRLHFNKGEF